MGFGRSVGEVAAGRREVRRRGEGVGQRCQEESTSS